MKIDDVKQFPSYFSDEDTEETKKLITSPDTFSMIKLSGQTFELTHGKEKTPLSDIIDCIIVGIGPIAKKYYEKPWNPASTEILPPDCASANGISPDKAIENPICSKCVRCEFNEFGSATSKSGDKVKAKKCKDYQRLVLYFSDVAFDRKLYRLDIPAASLKNVSKYGSLLNAKRYPFCGVITRISFDKEASYPKLIFTAIHVLDETKYNKIKIIREDPEINRLLTMETTIFTDFSDINEDANVEQSSNVKTIKVSEVAKSAPKTANVAQPAPVADSNHDDASLLNSASFEKEVDSVLNSLE